jgi:hypothetical protein
LLQNKNVAPSDEADLLTLKEAAAFLKKKPSTIYGLKQRGAIPCSKKGRLYFSKTELQKWALSGRKQTTDQLALESLSNRIKKNNY